MPQSTVLESRRVCFRHNELLSRNQRYTTSRKMTSFDSIVTGALIAVFPNQLDGIEIAL